VERGPDTVQRSYQAGGCCAAVWSQVRPQLENTLDLFCEKFTACFTVLRSRNVCSNAGRIGRCSM